MRDIKFRAWNGDDFDYLDLLSDFNDGDYYNLLNGGDAVVEQFTGLQDKNGKEVYEGDIIKQVYNNGYWIGETVYLLTEFHNGWYFRIIEMDYGFVDIYLSKNGYWGTGSSDDPKERYKVATQDDLVLTQKPERLISILPMTKFLTTLTATLMAVRCMKPM